MSSIELELLDITTVCFLAYRTFTLPFLYYTLRSCCFSTFNRLPKHRRLIALQTNDATSLYFAGLLLTNVPPALGTFLFLFYFLSSDQLLDSLSCLLCAVTVLVFINMFNLINIITFTAFDVISNCAYYIIIFTFFFVGSTALANAFSYLFISLAMCLQ
jgi:hypothetical protein